ncbi:MAG: hypothetical protein HY606_01600 [Planctomycetes bacterium]|nr:hypothetical protein [Planctomycetota bacterium]
MRIIKELDADNIKKFRHTFIQGQDNKNYKILTFKLYDIETGPEFPKFEVNVQQVKEDWTFDRLIVPHYCRFISKEAALDYHRVLLDKFDEILGLKSLQPQHHKESEADKH